MVNMTLMLALRGTRQLESPDRRSGGEAGAGDGGDGGRDREGGSKVFFLSKLNI